MSTGEVHSNARRGDISLSGGHIQAAASSGGDLDLHSGASASGDAGNLNIVSGSSDYAGGGHINIITSANTADERYWLSHIRREILPNEINFGFDDYTPLGFMERKIALQLKKTKDCTRYEWLFPILCVFHVYQFNVCHRLTSTVPLQVTTNQFSSDERIKKDITSANTEDLLDRIRQVELREYGYSDEWKKLRELKTIQGFVVSLVSSDFIQSL